jgi:hypothetical protein
LVSVEAVNAPADDSSLFAVYAQDAAASVNVTWTTACLAEVPPAEPAERD